jgi:hypothetical protein
VDWNEYNRAAEPVAVIEARQKPISLAVIPTIFITNRTIQQLPDNQVVDLAGKIFNKIKQIYPSISNQKPQEIQIDCDWSEKTRFKYFELLKYIDSQVVNQGIHISATIRLHQIKYPQITGVPPVARGMLMFYNMGSLQGNASTNSILDLKIAQQYTQKLDKYPLKLDLALPIFAWGVLSRRNRVINLIPNLRAEVLKNSANFILSKQNFYRVKKSHYLNGIYLYKDDMIRIEEVLPADLEKTFPLLQKMKKDSTTRLCFYHLDSHLLDKFSISFLQKTASSF